MILAAAFTATLLRAEGIAVSTDGMIWVKGVGGFGDGWDNAGRGVTVRQGETVYVKFYSESPDASLHFAQHGRKWGEWWSVGPVLTPDFGRSPVDPVILKISKIGTPSSTIAWVNGRGVSGIWSGPIAPGPYDLALHADARWTLPPIVVTEEPKPSLWAAFLGWLNGPSSSPASDRVHAVPDGGITAAFFAIALLVLTGLQRRRE